MYPKYQTELEKFTIIAEISNISEKRGKYRFLVQIDSTFWSKPYLKYFQGTVKMTMPDLQRYP